MITKMVQGFLSRWSFRNQTKWKVFFFPSPCFLHRKLLCPWVEQNSIIFYLWMSRWRVNRTKNKRFEGISLNPGSEIDAEHRGFYAAFGNIIKKGYAKNDSVMCVFLFYFITVFFFFHPRSPMQSEWILHKHGCLVTWEKIAVLITLWVNHHVSLSRKQREAADDH